MDNLRTNYIGAVIAVNDSDPRRKEIRERTAQIVSRARAGADTNPLDAELMTLFAECRRNRWDTLERMVDDARVELMGIFGQRQLDFEKQRRQ